jgi:hypothetical protein
MGGDFLRNASLQRRELVGHFGINYVRLGVRLDYGALITLASMVKVDWYDERKCLTVSMT